MKNNNLIHAKELQILSCISKMLCYTDAGRGQSHTGMEPESNYVDLLNELHDSVSDIRDEIMPKIL